MNHAIPADPSTTTVAERIAAVQQADSALALLRATQELAACSAPAAAPTLVEVLGFNNPGAAVAAVDGLISLGPAAVEALGDIGIAHPRVLAVVAPFIEHERPLIRSAAARTLLQLSGEDRWGHLLVELLDHPQLQVRRAALMDLGAAGWRPGFEAIAATLAENSLKLMALRGLVERGSGAPGDDALLACMDALL